MQINQCIILVEQLQTQRRGEEKQDDTPAPRKYL
jgi:hypothetical protein